MDATGLRRVEIENARGVVEVRPSADGRIHVTALKTVRARPASKARDLAREISVETRREGGAWRLKVRYPQRQEIHIGWRELFSGVELPNVSMRLTIEVPAGPDVRLRTVSGSLAAEGVGNRLVLESTSGDIAAEGVGGRLDVSTVSGDVTVDAAGPVAVRTVSGDVELRRAGGSARVSTTSGEVEVRAASDSLEIASVSGDVRVERADRGLAARTTSGGITARGVRGALDLSTSSGDVRATLARGLAAADIASGSGDVELRIAPGFGATFDLRTSNGALEAAVPLDVQSVTRRRLSGRLGDGATPVRLRTSSGDIQITSGGS